MGLCLLYEIFRIRAITAQPIKVTPNVQAPQVSLPAAMAIIPQATVLCLDHRILVVHPPVMPLSFPVSRLIMCLCLMGLLSATMASTTPLSQTILYTPLASHPLRFSSPRNGAAPGKSRRRILTPTATILRRRRKTLFCNLSATFLHHLVSMPVLLLALLHLLPLFMLLRF